MPLAPAVAAELARGWGSPRRSAVVTIGLDPAARGLARGERLPRREGFCSRLQRRSWRLHKLGAGVEVSLLEGQLSAAGGCLPVCELEVSLLSGPAPALLALVDRWSRRFGLLVEPRSLTARAERLAQGPGAAALRQSLRPVYPRRATADEAFVVVLDECLAQILDNTSGLIDGDPAQRGEPVHQLRVGLRRLRCALRCFDGWVALPSPELVEGLRGLFSGLAASRDVDVLNTGVARELALAGAPPARRPAAGAAAGAAAVVDPVQLIRSAEVQATLRAWLVWRAWPPVPANLAQTQAQTQTQFVRRAHRRLCRWHARITAAAARFDELDEPAVHDLRKRIKRQRYAVEFLAPLLKRRGLASYLTSLSRVQDRMGELNDLCAAKQQYRCALAQDPEPAAWFALGWLAARIRQARAAARLELGRLAREEPPGR